MRVAYRVRVEGTGLLAGVASPKQAVIPDETFFIRGQPAFFLGEGGQATVFVRRGAGEAVPGQAAAQAPQCGQAERDPAGTGQGAFVTIDPINTYEPYRGWIRSPWSPMRPSPEREAARTSGMGELSIKGSKTKAG